MDANDLIELTGELARLQAAIADFTNRAETIKDVLRKLGDGDHEAAGRPVVRVQTSRRFNVAKAYELVPEPLRVACMTTQIDPAKVRQYLAPALVDACMEESGKPRVSLL